METIGKMTQTVVGEINGQKSSPNPIGPCPAFNAKTASWDELRRENYRRRMEAVERSQRQQRAFQCHQESRTPPRHQSHADKFSGPPEWAEKREAAWEIVKAGGIIALVGTRGTGKTQLAVDLICRACNDGRRAQYAKAMDFFVELRATFKPDQSGDETKIMQQYQRHWLLTLDNVDRRGGSEWEDRLLTHLIDKRYDLGVSTILIANLDIAAFSSHVGSDIIDRIRDGGGLIVADWPGFRGAA